MVLVRKKRSFFRKIGLDVQWVKEKYPTSAEEDANSGKKPKIAAETPEGSETEEAVEGN